MEGFLLGKVNIIRGKAGETGLRGQDEEKVEAGRGGDWEKEATGGEICRALLKEK